MTLKNNFKQLFLYLIVGAIATAVEWVCFFIFNTTLGINHLIATALAYVISTFANWAAGRLIMFKANGKLIYELLKIYLVSIAGLLMNLGIMWVAVDLIDMNENLSKVLATAIVFAWNFLIRRLVIYKIDSKERL